MPNTLPGLRFFLARCFWSAVVTTGALSCRNESELRRVSVAAASRPRQRGPALWPCPAGLPRRAIHRLSPHATASAASERGPNTRTRQGSKQRGLTTESLPPGWLAAVAAKCSSLSALMAFVSSTLSLCAATSADRLGALASRPAGAGGRAGGGGRGSGEEGAARAARRRRTQLDLHPSAAVCSAASS